MRIPALVTGIPVQRMDSVVESDRHIVFVILDFMDYSANVSNVPHSIKAFSKYILHIFCRKRCHLSVSTLNSQ